MLGGKLLLLKAAQQSADSWLCWSNTNLLLCWLRTLSWLRRSAWLIGLIEEWVGHFC